MKKLLIFALLAGSTAHAGRMDEILIMTDESIQQTLGLYEAGAYQVTSQDFTKAAPERDLAIKTELILRSEPRNAAQQWTCVTQFVKTPKFFKVSETECNN